MSCVFVQIWVFRDNSTKLAHCLAESQELYTLTRKKNYSLCSDLFIALYTYLQDILLLYLTMHAHTLGGCSVLDSELSQWS